MINNTVPEQIAKWVQYTEKELENLEIYIEEDDVSYTQEWNTKELEEAINLDKKIDDELVRNNLAYIKSKIDNKSNLSKEQKDYLTSKVDRKAIDLDLPSKPIKKQIQETIFTGNKETKNGQVKIFITKNLMKGYASFYPSGFGGKPLTMDLVMSKISKVGIRYNIKENEIAEKIRICEKEKKIFEKVVIAEGLEPEQGEPDRIEILFETLKLSEQEKLRAIKKFIIEYNSLQTNEDKIIKISKKEAMKAEFYTGMVGERDKLLKIISGKPAKPGYNIRGEKIEAITINQPLPVVGMNVIRERDYYVSRINGKAVFFYNIIRVFHYRDAHFQITLDSIGQRAFLKVYPHLGEGEALDITAVIQECKRMNIYEFVDKTKMKDIISKAELEKKNVSGEIAVLFDDRDAFCSIKIAKDKMEAYISISPAIGNGKKISKQHVIEELKKYGVVFGILENEIERIVKKSNMGEPIEKILIAQGKPPKQGRDASIKFLFETTEVCEEEIKKLNIEIQENTIILKGYVKENQRLFEKNKLQKSEPGVNILGEKIIIEHKDIQVVAGKNVKREKDIYLSWVNGIAFVIKEENRYELFVKMYSPGDFKITLTEDKVEAFLTIVPAIGGAEPVKIKDIIFHARQMGIDKEKIDIDIIKRLIEKAQESQKTERERFAVLIESRNSTFDFTVSEDKMELYISLLPHSGRGKMLNFTEIMKSLEKEGIKFGIDKDLLLSLIENANQNGIGAENEIIGKGTEPIDGKDAELNISNYLLELKNKEKTLALMNIITKYGYTLPENEDIFIYKGFINKNEIIAEKIPAEIGKPGRDIYGKEIKQKKGKDLIIKAKKNVRIKRNQIIAERDGMCLISNFGIWIELYCDASYHIDIDEDRLAVKLTITPSLGEGKKISVKDIINYASELGIKAMLFRESIEYAIAKAEQEKKRFDPFLIARGTLPINGKDDEVIFFFKKNKGDKNRIISKDIGFINPVKEQGKILSIIHSDVKPINGVDVFGKEIRASEGEKKEFIKGQNVEIINNKNRTNFYSKINGQVHIDGNLVSVFPILILDSDVDIKIGNIDFPGDILIKGNINDNSIVKANGDIKVLGSIFNSDIEGRDIYVNGGIILSKEKSLIANGDVKARYIENSRIIAAGNVYVDDSILNSRIDAGGIVNALSGKGHIIGGIIRAKEGVKAKFLGSSSGSRTIIKVGLNFVLEEYIQNTKNKRKKLQKKLKKVKDIIDRLTSQMHIVQKNEKVKELYINALRRSTLFKHKIHQYYKQEAEMELEFSSSFYMAEVIANQSLYADVDIQIQNHILHIRHTTNSARVYMDKQNRIIVSSIDINK